MNLNAYNSYYFPKLSIDVMAENKIKNETPHSLESEITEYGEQF